jgi:hypothetical protein
VATQIAFSHHYGVAGGQLETLSAPFRYVWPSDLDLMARLGRAVPCRQGRAVRVRRAKKAIALAS